MNFIVLGRDIHFAIGKIYYNLAVGDNYVSVCDLSAYARVSVGVYSCIRGLLLDVRNIYGRERYPLFTKALKEMLGKIPADGTLSRKRKLIINIYNKLYHHRHILYARISIPEHKGEDNIIEFIVSYERLAADDSVFRNKCHRFRILIKRVQVILGEEYERIMLDHISAHNPK